jgi:AraC family carnitine catabolism transcriptional activator
MKLGEARSAEDIGPATAVFVLGSWGAERYENPAAASWLRKRHRTGEMICAVELCCYLVARAGLLKDKTATTHWSCLPGFLERFEDVQGVDRLFTMKDRVMTCAGGLAGVDLLLRLIERTHGAALAGEIADQMLHHPIRSEATPQRHTMGQSTDPIAPLLREAMLLIERNMEDPLRVPDIARALGVSQRQLERQFKKHLGCTVVQFGLLVRLQSARVLLISTSLSVREIATASGFNTLSHFAHAFRNLFGRRPSEYREAWPADDDAPLWPGTLPEIAAALKTRRVPRAPGLSEALSLPGPPEAP